MLEITPPRLYVNGFPKSGLHLSTQMVNCLFEPVSTENNWYGTNAWTLSRHSLDQAVDKFSEIKPRHFLKGHAGYMSELDELCDVLRVAMLLIYRDLRDVVVSQTYHILSENENLHHGGLAAPASRRGLRRDLRFGQRRETLFRDGADEIALRHVITRADLCFVR